MLGSYRKAFILILPLSSFFFFVNSVQQSIYDKFKFYLLKFFSFVVVFEAEFLCVVLAVLELLL